MRSSVFYGFGIGDIGGENDGLAAETFALALGVGEAVFSSCNKTDARSMTRKLVGDRAAQSCGCTCDHHNFILGHGILLMIWRCAQDSRRCLGAIPSMQTRAVRASP